MGHEVHSGFPRTTCPFQVWLLVTQPSVIVPWPESLTFHTSPVMWSMWHCYQACQAQPFPSLRDSPAGVWAFQLSHWDPGGTPALPPAPQVSWGLRATTLSPGKVRHQVRPDAPSLPQDSPTPPVHGGSKETHQTTKRGAKVALGRRSFLCALPPPCLPRCCQRRLGESFQPRHACGSLSFRCSN